MLFRGTFGVYCRYECHQVAISLLKCCATVNVSSTSSSTRSLEIKMSLKVSAETMTDLVQTISHKEDYQVLLIYRNQSSLLKVLCKRDLFVFIAFFFIDLNVSNHSVQKNGEMHCRCSPTWPNSTCRRTFRPNIPINIILSLMSNKVSWSSSSRPCLRYNSYAVSRFFP